MPMSKGTYYAPTWINNAPPAIDATEMQAISDTAAIVPTLVRPNLLDNWFFIGGGSQAGDGHFPINQRGLTSYSVNGYTIDRWRTNFSNDTVTVESTGVKCLNASTSVGWHLHQIISDMDELIGATVTASFFVVGVLGTYLKPIISFRNSSDTEISSINLTSNPTTGVISLTGVVPANTSKIRVGFYASSGIASGNYIQVSAAKFEVGGTQTLAHYDSANSVWVLNEVPNYDEQLFRCQTSTADSTDTYANQTNLVGYQVRPNVVDNWDFRAPINSRGLSSYSGANVYSIDRWYVANTTITVAVQTGGLLISGSSSMPSGYRLFEQILNWNYSANTQVTITARILSCSGTFRLLFGSSSDSNLRIYSEDFSSAGLVTATGSIGSGITKPVFALASRAAGTSSVKIDVVKVEIGDSQTLCHNVGGSWVVSEPPIQAYSLLRSSLGQQVTNSDTGTALPLFRQEAFFASDTNPSINGTINWTYG